MEISFKIRGVKVNVSFDGTLYSANHVKYYYRAAKNLDEFEEL